MEKSFINSNLIKLLEKFGFENSRSSLEDSQSEDAVKFKIPDDSCFGRILNYLEVEDFLEKEDVKWRELLNQKESETPAFADLARLSKVNVYSGVRDWTRYFKNYTSGDLKYLNHNGSVPTEYVTIASASKYSKNLNFRFGESGLFFKPTCALLFGKQDFGSCGVGAALDPRMAFLNYNEKKFNRKNLAFDLNGIAKKLQYDFYLHSTDLHLENTRNKYANEKNQIINRFKSFFSPHQRERKLNRDIAKSKGFASKGFAMLYGKETEYSEMHLPATILLAEGVFSLDCLTENSLKQYEVICNLKEFLSSDQNITESQLNIFKRLLAKDFLESNGLELLKSKFLEIRSDFLENTAKYFNGITASHQIRVEELIEDDKMEEAIALALQSDYFKKFTTTAGIQQHLKNPLNIKIFNSKTNEVENILQEEVLLLIEKIDLVKKIIEDDKVKATDRESLKKIFNKVDLRKIIEYFTKDGETSFPAEAIDNDKLNLEKLLKIDNLQEFFKPFFDDCDQKLDNIKQEEKEIKFLTAPLFLIGMAFIILSAAVPPTALFFLPVGVLLSVGSVAFTLVNKVYSLIAQEQLKELKEGRPEINKKQAFAKIVGKCYNSFTSYFIKQKLPPATPFIGTEQQSPPATPLEPATIGAPATSLWPATIGAVAKENTEMSI